jgi:CBS domain-containing protein
MNMKVKELMTSNPTVVKPDDNVAQAATLMKQEDCGALPVVSNGKLVGIITDRDIVIRAVAAGKDAKSTPISAVMTADPVTIAPDASDDEAEKLMAKSQVRRLPVVENGKLVGIITDRDIVIRAVASGKDAKSTPISAVMSADPVTVAPDDSDDEAEKVMAKSQVRRLPVVENGKLVGILVTAQLARRGNTGELGETIREISEPKSGKGSHARG